MSILPYSNNCSKPYYKVLLPYFFFSLLHSAPPFLLPFSCTHIFFYIIHFFYSFVTYIYPDRACIHDGAALACVLFIICNTIIIETGVLPNWGRIRVFLFPHPLHPWYSHLLSVGICNQRKRVQDCPNGLGKSEALVYVICSACAHFRFLSLMYYISCGWNKVRHLISEMNSMIY